MKLGVLAFVMAAVVSIARAADDAQSVFDSIYGAKLKLAASTPSTADDVELAKSLLDAARSAGSTPDFQLLLLKNAAELAAKDPAGFDTAIAARKLEADIKPDLKPAALEAITAIQQRRYNTAKTADKPAAGELLLDALLDEAAAKSDDAEASQQIYRKAVTLAAAIKSPRQSQVKATAEAAQSRSRITARIAELKAKLKANPADKISGRELVMIHFVTLDSPEQARQFTFLTDDTDLTAHVTLANTDPAGLTDAQCMDMGEWYRKLADTEYVAKLPLLARAGGYYQRYLELHTAADLERTKATLALKSIKQTLDAAKVEIRPLGLAAAPASSSTNPVTPSSAAEPRIGEWFDLLKLVDPARDAVTGTWQRDDAGLANTDRDNRPRITLPILPAGDYDLRVTFVRHSGGSDVSVMFPVGAGQTQLVLGGWGGNDISGLQVIDGAPVSINATTTHYLLENGVTYTADIHVRLRDQDADIQIEVNQKPFLRWSGRQASLALYRDWNFPNTQTPGLAVDNGVTALFSTAKLRLLTGKATLFSKPAAVATPGEWTDLLKGVDPVRDAVKGTWSLSVAGQLSASGDAILALPGANTSAYEMEASFIRTEGDDGVMFAFPAGTGRGQLFFSAEHGGVSKLAAQDHGNFANTATVRPGKIENNHTYQLRIRVVPDLANVAVTIELDGKPYSKYLGPQSSLIQFPSWSLPQNKVFGFGVQTPCRLVVTAMRTRPLTADSAPAPAATGEWTDLLKGIDPERDKGNGVWNLTAAGLTNVGPDFVQVFGLPGQTTAAYEMDVKFTRIAGDNTILLAFPAGSAKAQFFLSEWHGKYSALAMVNDDTSKRQNQSNVQPGTIENNHPYLVHLRVIPDGADVDITIELDGKPYSHYRGPQANLVVANNWLISTGRVFGLGAALPSRVIFSAVRMRPLNAAADAGEWTDLLKTADPARNAVKGMWKLEDGKLFSNEFSPHDRITFGGDIRGPYELQARFTRNSGDGDIAFFFPVGSARAHLALSAYGGGLSALNIRGTEFNISPAVVKPGKLENGHDYSLNIRVVPDGANATITITLDGQPYLTWRGAQADLGTHYNWPLPAEKRFAVGTYNCTATFTALRYRAADAGARSDAGNGQWTDLLKLVDLDKHAFHSRESWSRDASGALTTAYGDQQAPSRDVMLPLTPDGSYELQVKFTRNQGIDTPAILLPVGSAHTQFLFSAFGGQSTGFAIINGVYVTGQDDSLRVRPGKLTNGQEYTADFRVVLQDQNADITVRLDGKDYLHWQGPQSALSGRAPPDPKAIGLMSWKSSVTFRSVKVRPIGGTLRPVAEKSR